MKKQIWKYNIEVQKEQLLSMPAGAKILTVQLQGSQPVLWALVYPDAEKTNRLIEVFGTGYNIDFSNGGSRDYIATFQTDDNLVFHVFEYTGYRS